MDPDRRKAKQLLRGVQKSFGMAKGQLNSSQVEGLDSIIGKAMIGVNRDKGRGKNKSSRD